MHPKERAIEALCSDRFDVDLGEPFAATILRARAALGATTDPQPLLWHWQRVHPGSPTGEMRYRWGLAHRRIPVPSYCRSWQEWQPWRPREQEVQQHDVFAFEERLTVPIVLTECGALLASLDLEDAKTIRAECEPIMRRDFAKYIQALHPSTDTFALWCLAKETKMLGRLHPVAYAIAVSYASETMHDGRQAVIGKRFPFHDHPLVSASAQLAYGLYRLGTDLSLAAELTNWVTAQQRRSGGYGDEKIEDPLTTLVAADLLLHLDPAFDPAPVASYFEARQREGIWSVYGPESPWLTKRIIDWYVASEKPFADRFVWPFLREINRDPKTALPFFAWFNQTVQLFSALPGIASATTDVAFIDLIGFRAFNNRFGQDKGDEVLRAFAAELKTIPAATAIRDGGDEFLVIGAPTRTNLMEDLDGMRHQWPDRFRERFGADTDLVTARILVTTCRCDALLKTRESLGRAIGQLKSRKDVPPSGILEET